MTARLRLLLHTSRPAVVFILLAYAALGLAQVREPDVPALLRLGALVVGFVLASVVMNDIADEAVDRVNLAGDPARLLATGAVRRSGFLGLGVSSAGVALAVAATFGWAALAVVGTGLLLSAAYSLPPLRLARRGVVAPLVLPTCYVVVPYIAGVLAGGQGLAARDLALLPGLYVGFIGRILLKDFRDVRGDALFGKRTFLVRHGRAWTCLVSAVCWVVGAALSVLAVRPTPMLAAVIAAAVATVLVLLRGLSFDGGPRRDEAVIAAIAIVGRSLVLAVLAHLSMAHEPFGPAVQAVVLLALAALTGGQAYEMIRHGPAGVVGPLPTPPAPPAQLGIMKHRVAHGPHDAS